MPIGWFLYGETRSFWGQLMCLKIKTSFLTQLLLFTTTCLSSLVIPQLCHFLLLSTIQIIHTKVSSNYILNISSQKSKYTYSFLQTQKEKHTHIYIHTPKTFQILYFSLGQLLLVLFRPFSVQFGDSKHKGPW